VGRENTIWQENLYETEEEIVRRKGGEGQLGCKRKELNFSTS
jgi:hypothetical protein